MNRKNKGKSIVSKLNDYTVIDIETTGLSPDLNEIIEFSGVKVRTGIIVDTFSVLVKPKWGIDCFITNLTGITNEMVENAPSIENIIENIIHFIGNDVIVGHNVNFDINFLYDNLYFCKNLYLSNDYIDIMRLYRKIFPDIKNHKLKTLSKEFNKVNFPTHRSLSDCLATYELMTYFFNYIKTNNINLEELFKKRPIHALNVKEIVANVDNIDEDNTIFKMFVCFTGTLSKMVRKDALQLVANLGGYPMNSVTKKTNFLVLGDVDYKESKNNVKSSKYKKAESLILEGSDLLIIDETTFLDMIDDDIEKEYYR